MNPDTISNWLQSSDTLPDEVDVKSLLRLWPWFAPGRLMEAAQEHHRQPFAPRSLSLLHLYGPDWVSSYRLITGADRKAFRPMSPTELADMPEWKKELLPEITEPQIQPEPIAEISTPADLSAEVAEYETPVDPAPAQHPAVPLIQPLYTEDYFRHQGVAPEKEEEIEEMPGTREPEPAAEGPNKLMVVMSFSEWLSHFKIKNEKEQEEEREKRALRSMWQQEKLAAALEVEAEEIPEDVFEMAVSSITREDGLITESLAEILEKQEKWAAAADMYRKLGLRNPAKSSYFASRAEAAQKRLL